MAVPVNFIDMTGRRIGEWTVLEKDLEKSKNYNGERTYWVCECSCGIKESFEGRRLRNGTARKNCGCIKKKLRADKESTIEFQQNKRFKNIWGGIKERCYSESYVEYFRYGGAGITMDERWLSFENFKSDMFESYILFEQEFGLNSATIDRIDSTGNYEPSNCRWLTLQQQARNRKDNIEVTVKGKTYGTLIELTEDYAHINYDTLRSRYRLGLRGDDLIATRRELWEKKQEQYLLELESK